MTTDAIEKEKLVSGKSKNKVVKHPGVLRRAAKRANQRTEYPGDLKDDNGKQSNSGLIGWN